MRIVCNVCVLCTVGFWYWLLGEEESNNNNSGGSSSNINTKHSLIHVYVFLQCPRRTMPYVWVCMRSCVHVVNARACVCVYALNVEHMH